MRVLDLFSGIGGFSLGLERTGGFETVAFCEIEPFCQLVLAKHWPKVPCYNDVRTLTADRLAADGIGVDVICGGFPCQDISFAGSGVGLQGERSGLWREYSRLISELRPQFVIVENVSALLSRGLGDVLRDLAEIGYDAEWHCIPASYVDAGHLRDRIWVVANPASHRRKPYEFDVASPQTSSRRQCSRNGPKIGWKWEPEPCVDRVVHGLPKRMDRVTALGNAVVPQIPELIGRAILAAESAP
jgi:DNA (cytosine-5)-methyltransferase 1